MKTKNLFFFGGIPLLLIVPLSLLVINGLNMQSSDLYKPRESKVRTNDDANGAIAYLHHLRANQNTGEVNPADVLKAKAEIAHIAAKQAAPPLNLTWEEMGPDNVGGRTRAILIDRNNSQRMYAAAVSGGLWISSNGGNSWEKYDDFLDNLAVVSLTQSANGDIYFGTGEGMYYSNTGDGTSGLLGGGIWKSTDDGQTFTRLTSTIPFANSTGADWANVGKLASDPSNANRIYAGTNRGLRISDDGGTTWTNAFSSGPGFSNNARDLVVASDGSIFTNIGTRVYYSANGNPGSFQEITGISIPSGVKRIRLAVSSQDVNYVYAVVVGSGSGNSSNFRLHSIYRSTDKGASWTQIGIGGGAGSLFDTHGNQGLFNCALEVDVKDKDRIIMGGVELWEWTLSGGWSEIASLGGNSFTNPLYVHADKHHILFHPTDLNTIYVATDGGMFRSFNNGNTWEAFNRNYSTVQFYSVAFSETGLLLGGTQDNGTIYINKKGNTTRAGIRTIGITQDDNIVVDGDGAYCEISKLNSRAFFKSMQYGVLGRSENGGTSFRDFYDEPKLSGGEGSSGFVTPYLLWESTNDTNSIDSVLFIAAPAFLSLGFGDGITTNYSSTLRRPQETAVFAVNTFRIEVDGMVITSDGAGNLSGDGTGSFNLTTGNFSVTFNTAPIGEIQITCSIGYPSGSRIRANSAINSYPFYYVLPAEMTPGDTIIIQDPIQSNFVVGMRNEVWMTRKALDFSTTTPDDWAKIANVSGDAQCMAFSKDGDVLFIGVNPVNTSTGLLYRVTNIINARTDNTASLDSSAYVLQATLIETYSQVITSISVNPDNTNDVILTLGNYGNTTHVYRSTNALSASPTFNSRQGNLPAMPVYASTFDQANPNSAIIGTEFGIWTTDNINVASPSWTQENTGMANVPVFMLRQQYTERPSETGDTVLNGIIYAATHGRGLYRSTSLASANPIGIEEEEQIKRSTAMETLQLYPNPVRNYTTVPIYLSNSSDVKVRVRNIKGQLVLSRDYLNMSGGEQTIRIDAVNLKSGIYIATLETEDRLLSGKFIVTK